MWELLTVCYRHQRQTCCSIRSKWSVAYRRELPVRSKWTGSIGSRLSYSGLSRVPVRWDCLRSTAGSKCSESSSSSLQTFGGFSWSVTVSSTSSACRSTDLRWWRLRIRQESQLCIENLDDRKIRHCCRFLSLTCQRPAWPTCPFSIFGRKNRRWTSVPNFENILFWSELHVKHVQRTTLMVDHMLPLWVYIEGNA